MRRILLLAACILLLASCATPTPTPKPGELANLRGEYFSTSGNCVTCHTNMKDESGANVSTDSFWRATMLANAARDPYWQATVRSEITQAKAYREVIEKKCSACHMPMAEFTSVTGSKKPRILDDGYTKNNNKLHLLAMDGVSCALCHQITPENYGQTESFSGGFAIEKQQPAGERAAFGPYPVQAALATQMQSASGFLPQEKSHLAQSEMCATCHNLITPYLDASGEIAGEFPEQMIYSEWLNSAYARQQSCQSCHMPMAQGGVKLSITGGPLRSPFLQHHFVGGNAYMGQVLQANAAAVGLTATDQQMQTIIDLAREQIETQTAEIRISNARIENGLLLADLSVQSQVGHKFPAGFPSRRVWLHISVIDAAGNTIFESGAVDASGRIAGNDNDDDPALFEAHYTELSDPAQVQVYEAVMLDSDGQVTTTLLRAASYAKDNRLLPAGFDQSTASSDIAVMGQAAADADFTAGSDNLRLRIDAAGAQGPFLLRAELLYQTIGYRWAQNIIAQDSGEAHAFAAYTQNVPNTPLRAADAEITIQ